MQQFYRCLLGEFKKRKRSYFMLLHFVLPFILITILVLYAFLRNTPLSETASYVILFEIIGVSTPVIISVLCGMVADTESEAGHFQNILGVSKNKVISFLSQITMMLLSYSIAIFFTISLYICAITFIVHGVEVHLSLYYCTGLIFIATAIFQYFFYHFVSYKYGIEISGIFGIMGVVIGALSLTSLGDKVWVFLPWAWANRFSEYVIPLREIDGMSENIISGFYAFIIITGCIIAITISWISKWEGRRQ